MDDCAHVRVHAHDRIRRDWDGRVEDCVHVHGHDFHTDHTLIPSPPGWGIHWNGSDWYFHYHFHFREHHPFYNCNNHMDSVVPAREEEGDGNDVLLLLHDVIHAIRTHDVPDGKEVPDPDIHDLSPTQRQTMQKAVHDVHVHVELVHVHVHAHEDNIPDNAVEEHAANDVDVVHDADMLPEHYHCYCYCCHHYHYRYYCCSRRQYRLEHW